MILDRISAIAPYTTLTRPVWRVHQTCPISYTLPHAKAMWGQPTILLFNIWSPRNFWTANIIKTRRNHAIFLRFVFSD